MTDSERALLRQDEVEMLERDKQATPGPFKFYADAEFSMSCDYPWIVALAYGVGPCGRNVVCNRMTEADAEFFAHARTDVPELLRRLAAARAGEGELLEKACKAVCESCAKADPLEIGTDGVPRHPFLKEGTVVARFTCDALEIRKLAESLQPVAESETK